MTYHNPQHALKAYQQVGVQTATAGASPHMLIHMLLHGLLERIASAKGMMLRNEAGKGNYISRAISILDELRASLNFEVGGELADNLDNLYEYCQRCLLQANMKNDTSILDEVTVLVRDIKDAWDAIGGTAAEAVPQSGSAR